MAVKLSLGCTQNSQSVANNTSNVTITAKVTWTYGSWNEYQKPGYVIIDGTRYDFKSSFNANATTSGSQTIFTKTLNIAHGNDGKKTLNYSGFYSTGVSSGDITATGSKKLTDIPRQANITGAPNFNDEENPAITYSNPAGTAVEALKACIAKEDGATILVPYRDISKTGTSYTFNLTTAEREALRKATPNSNTLVVKFYVQTTIAGVVYYSSIAKTLTIKNPSPTLSPTAVDANATTKTLTGDANKFIKYYSNASFSVGAAAVKNSTIKSTKVVCGAKSSTSASGTLNAVESGTFTFSATDSRGNTTTKTLTKTLVNYVKLTCNLTTKNPTPDGKMYFKVSGNYFNNTFGAVANTLQVQYRVKENEDSYGNWIDLTTTKSGNTYSAEVNLTGLNYQSYYTFQARAIDKINTSGVNSAEKKVRATPVFDWGENDFKFNVPVYDHNGGKLGTEMTAENQTAVAVTGKILQETGFVSITPVANTPTSAAVKFKKTYKKIPTIVMSVASGVPGTQVLGYGQTGISTTGVNIVVTRTNTTPTILYYYVFGEVAD